MSPKSTTLVPVYSDNYIESVFFLWYGAGRDIRVSIPPSEEGNTPNPLTVAAWKRRYAWEERADVLDAEVSRKLEKQAVEKKAKAITKMAEAGEAMLDAGLRFIKENDKFDTHSSAVRAVIGGADLLAQYAGIGEFIMGRMNNAQLTKELYRLLGKNENEDGVVDVDATMENEDASDKSENDNDG